MNKIFDKIFKTSRIVKDVLRDVYDNPESWNKSDEYSISKGPICIKIVAGTFWDLNIDGSAFLCTTADKFKLKRSVKWWMSEAPLVNLRINN